MSEAEKIAAGLTEAQRRALLGAWPISGPSHGAFLLEVGERTFNQLWGLDLVNIRNLLTPLGLEVRKVLQS
jgi:hypothetical protein